MLHTTKFVYEITADYEGVKHRFKILADTHSEAQEKAQFFGGKILTVNSLFSVNMIK